MAREGRKTKRPPVQLELPLVGAVGRTRGVKPKSVSEEFSFRDFARRFYADTQERRS